MVETINFIDRHKQNRSCDSEKGLGLNACVGKMACTIFVLNIHSTEETADDFPLYSFYSSSFLRTQRNESP